MAKNNNKSESAGTSGEGDFLKSKEMKRINNLYERIWEMPVFADSS
jgi:hypothetical protein